MWCTSDEWNPIEVTQFLGNIIRLEFVLGITQRLDVIGFGKKINEILSVVLPAALLVQLNDSNSSSSMINIHAYFNFYTNKYLLKWLRSFLR